MIEIVAEIAGSLFLVALGLEFAAVFAEQAGGVRKAGEEKPRPGFAAMVLMILATVTPGLLLAHAFVTTMDVHDQVRIWAIGGVIAAVVAGALLGMAAGLFGGEGVSRAMRALSLPLNLAAFGLAVFVARTSINQLIDMLQNGAPAL
ncbi:MAG: hypothetical protein AB7P07_02020 [Hyphomonadaceae bacterium]